MRRRSLLVAATACLAPLVAQADAPVRRPTFVRVLDAAGEPIGGATVTFAGCLPHVGVLHGPHDVQVVAADARGRAQARLREGLCYLAWAASETGGRQQLAGPVGWFGAGALRTLVAEEVERPRRVRLRGLEAWAAATGPLRVFAATPVPGAEHELEPVDGAVALPLLPDVRLVFRTADGHTVCQRGLEEGVVTVPPPRPLPVRVVDETGAPLPGALLTQRTGRHQSWGLDGWATTLDWIERPLGRTGDDGTTTVTVCADGDLLAGEAKQDVLLFASAPGRPAVAGGRTHGALFVDDRRVPKLPADVLSFTLRRAEPLVGWVGTVPAGTVAHLVATCMLSGPENSYLHDRRSFVAPVGADGSVVLPQVPPTLHACRLVLLPPDALAAAVPILPPRAGRELPFAPPPAGSAPPLPAGDLTVQVVDPLGGPGRGEVAQVVPGRVASVPVRDAALFLPLDASGQLRVRLATGPWHVMVLAEAGWAAASFVVEGGARRETLTLAPLPQLQVQLLDENGAPVPGARVVSRGTSTRSTGDPMQALLQNLQHGLGGTWARLRTDAAGRVAIPFVPIEGHVRRLRLDVDGRSSPEFELEARADTVELRLR
ncbi:MAG: hypothetical protein KF830_06970 [Planctomycetes bacterium]|nr:hypothetical protein [Planctomycetota bacterium]